MSISWYACLQSRRENTAQRQAAQPRQVTQNYMAYFETNNRVAFSK